METHAGVQISFSGVDVATANQLAGDLADSLQQDAPTLMVERIREDRLTQDFGASLAIILGTSAVTALARGIAAWLARRQDARLVLRRTGPNGEVRELVIDGQVSGRAERLVSEFFGG